MGLEQATMPQTCKLYDNDGDGDMSTYSTLAVFFFGGISSSQF
jgi:hypothetical protein